MPRCLSPSALLISLILLSVTTPSTAADDSLPPRVYKATIQPNWFGENGTFRYRNELPGETWEFVKVEGARGTREPAFDHDRIAYKELAQGERHRQHTFSGHVWLATDMTGELLLIVGELDHNVDPASTMQVVDALIEADRDFEMLVIPGAGHGAAGTAYGKRRQEEFFVEHFLE